MFSNQLRGNINCDLTTLQIILKEVANQNYKDNIYTLQQGIITSTISDQVPPIDFLVQREINKCFKSIVSSLQDYLDQIKD